MAEIHMHSCNRGPDWKRNLVLGNALEAYTCAEAMRFMKWSFRVLISFGRDILWVLWGYTIKEHCNSHRLIKALSGQGENGRRLGLDANLSIIMQESNSSMGEGYVCRISSGSRELGNLDPSNIPRYHLSDTVVELVTDRYGP